VPERPKPIPQVVTELWELIVAYARQETLTPLRSLGRVVALGSAGSLLVGIGAVCWGIGVLRLLQAEAGTAFEGTWSFVPYLAVTVLLVLGGGAVFAFGTRDRSGRRG
jgi:hypothetical protein